MVIDAGAKVTKSGNGKKKRLFVFVSAPVSQFLGASTHLPDHHPSKILMPVLTRRAATVARKSEILNILPGEMTTEIISYCDTTSKAALCRVSKHFKQLAHRQLYQIVKLGAGENIISFGEALSANPEYTTWIRDLSMETFDSEGSEPVNRILRSATELRKLSLEWLMDMPACLQNLTFPRLQTLQLGGDYHGGTIVPAFINRHPTLLHLASSFHKETQQLNLPNLITYRGGSSLSVLGTVPRLRSVSLVLSHIGTSSDVLNVLTRFSGLQNLVISSTRLGMPTIRHIFNLLIDNFPHLKSLKLTSTFMIDIPV
ncbi:hypothetical protein C8J56DRAFT_1057351 [Mycena floridula]|nr:hypothetical protein C8J56DRAFT_1057351 [Mycena floridula]